MAKDNARLFEFRDGKSDKFWEIALDGNSHTVRYGRVGTDGQSSTKEFLTAEKALASHDKLISQKLKKGYQEISDRAESRSAQVKASKEAWKEHEPFLNAILKDPDDFAPYGVYSDWLAERGDPRGEFMQLQWQLEDANLQGDARAQVEAAEKALLKQHRETWIEELAPDLTENWMPDGLEWVNEPYSFTFARGFLDSLVIEYLLPEFANKLRRSRVASMLRRLEVDYVPRGEELTEELDEYADKEWDYDDSPSLDAVASGVFANLRTLTLGEGIAPNAHKLVKNAPRLEVLRLESHEVDTDALFGLKMPNLRSLTVNNLTHYPTEVLAQNASLGQLQTIVFQPHAFEYDDDEPYLVQRDIEAICDSKHLKNLKHLHLQCTDFGDEGIATIIESGLLGRLETLKLPSGATTDAGAEMLLDADLSHLRKLDLSGNYLGRDVAERFRDKKVSISAEAQNDIQGLAEDRMHLFDGDME